MEMNTSKHPIPFNSESIITVIFLLSYDKFSNDSLDLIDTMREAQTTFNLFLNNRFELAEDRMITL